MEGNEIPSTSGGHVLHVSADKVPRHRMSFFAVEPTVEVDLKKKQRFVKFKEFVEKITRNLGASERTRRPRSMWEHTLFGKHSVRTTCPNCLYCIETDVRYFSTCVTHLIAISLLPICMCALPYWSIIFRDTVHYCPRCMIYLGMKFSKGRKAISRWIGFRNIID